jgi:hypothetical protein
MKSFVESCLAGEVLLEEIDDYVENWHLGGTGLSLQEYIGLTREEYATWVHDADSMRLIVSARKYGKPLAEWKQESLIAARAKNPAEAKKALEWIKTKLKD